MIGLPSGREGEGAVDGLANADVFEGGIVLEGDPKRGREAVEIGLEQLG